MAFKIENIFKNPVGTLTNVLGGAAAGAAGGPPGILIGAGAGLLASTLASGGGGGGGSGATQVPVDQLQNIINNNTRAIGISAYGTIDTGRLVQLDPGKVVRTTTRVPTRTAGGAMGSKGFNTLTFYTVRDSKGKELFRSTTPQAAESFVKQRAAKAFQVVGKDGKVMFTGKDKAAAQKFIDNRKNRPESPPPLVPEITKLSDNFVKSVDNLVASGKKQLNAEEKDLLNRIKGYNTQLNQTQDREDALLKKDLDAITRDLNKGAALLDAQDRREFSSALSDFNQRAEAVTTQFDRRASGIVDEGDAENRGILATGDAESKAAISEFQTEGIGLGDRYLAATQTASSNFDQAFEESLDLSPERLSIFTNAADFLSKAAQQTRMDMLATADPRALELSAIADENAAAMMSGRIGADVQANLARSSAMRALGGGFGAGSEMGRGLAARDLGLTSLDLMRQGTEMSDAQRRLNFDTRVSGLQADSGALLKEDMDARQQQALTNYEAALGVAESDRDQRQGIFKTVLDNNLARIDTRTERDLDRVDTRVGRDLGIAGNVLQSRLETNRLGFDARRDNISERTARNNARLTNIWDRNFQSRQSVYGENLNTARSIYSTNANVAGNIFNTNANALYQNTAAHIEARDKAAGNKIAIRTGVFDALNAARSGGAATLADATMANWANNNAWNASQVTTNQNLWGSAINSAATTFGALAGSLFNRPQSTGYNFAPVYNTKSDVAGAFGLK